MKARSGGAMPRSQILATLLMIHCWFCADLENPETEEEKCCGLHVPAVQTVSIRTNSGSSDEGIQTVMMKHVRAANAPLKAHARLERKPWSWRTVGASQFRPTQNNKPPIVWHSQHPKAAKYHVLHFQDTNNEYVEY